MDEAEERRADDGRDFAFALAELGPERARVERGNPTQRATVVPSQNLNPDILMMKPAEDWYCCDAADLLRRPKIRRILAQ